MQNFVLSLLTTTLVTSVLILVFSGLSAFLKTRLSPAVRYFLWIMILVNLIVPVRPIIGQGVVKVPSVPIESTRATSQTAATSAAKENIWDAVSGLPWLHILLVIWFLGCLFFLSKQVFAFWKFKKLIKRWANPIETPAMLEALDRTKASLGLSQNVQLLHYPYVKSPMMTGFIKPLLLLPELDYGDEDLDLILEHELTHLKHKDIYANLLSIVATSLHWFNPIVHFAAKEMQEAGELFCDSSVLNRHNDDYRFYYGETILTMIDRSRHRPIQLTTCFYSNKFNLKRRIASIMENGTPKKILSSLLLALVGLSIIFSGSIFVLATHSPHPTETGQETGNSQALRIALQEFGFSKEEVQDVLVEEDDEDYLVTLKKDDIQYQCLIRKSDMKVRKAGQKKLKESNSSSQTSTNTSSSSASESENLPVSSSEPAEAVPQPAQETPSSPAAPAESVAPTAVEPSDYDDGDFDDYDDYDDDVDDDYDDDDDHDD